MHKIIRLHEVKARTGLARSTIYRELKKETFPKQISLGARSVGWLEKDIENWIQSRITESQNRSYIGAFMEKKTEKDALKKKCLTMKKIPF